MIRYNPKGLTTPQIDESRRRHGDNVITPPKDDSAWRLLLEKFRDPIIRILLLAAVLSLIIGFVHKDFTESVGIICAIILATCVGFWFEWDAQRRFRRLNQVNDDIPVKVMREGSIREIPRRDVVTGDVVYIESGETIPADGELVGGIVYFDDMAQYGSGGTATQEKDAAGIRLLGVDPRFRGAGAGKALAQACIRRARERGHAQVILHTTAAMGVAWKMYEQLGFARSEDLDFLQEQLPVFGFRLKLQA